MKKDLEFVLQQQKEIMLLAGTGALLEWDRETYMPKQGIMNRAEQAAIVSRLVHEKVVSEKFYGALKRLVKPRTLRKLSAMHQFIVKRAFKDVRKARKLPPEFVAEMARTTALANHAWVEAKQKNRFRLFAPHLKKIVELKRRQAKLIGLEGHPYNSLLDGFEEGMTVEKLRKTFSYLKAELLKLLEEIKQSKKFREQGKKLFRKKFPVEKQKKLCRLAYGLILPAAESRLDVSAHPFTTTIGRHDVRITTRYHEENPFFSLSATVHESGHALYELQLPKQFEHTFIFDAPSLGVHESQSLFWENMVLMNEGFWDYFYQRFCKEVREELKGLSRKEVLEKLNEVKPSFIRVDADEVTYPLHVILRFELELGLIEGKIKVNDLPKLWNRKMKQYLGITPGKDSEGVLQDTHWSIGHIGYFPTYALGAIYAVQLYKRLLKEMPSARKQIANGNFEPVKGWLHKKVHCHGRKFTAEEIIRKATGKNLDSEGFVSYLREKYSKIYGLK
ncbi:MAG: carboxypeptidase M32 [Candidatus Diapherotrites archaeon]|uniref:Metal-dependent carboxypeptidase n=1 Tax=Candidatus Iainarchaeum sp. TaxID=3101447 RepID=A0A8T4KXW2_9ARCH|nr:carboxypeptidase M32 [Candidatus Diapherotrites archaeon]